MTQDDLTRPALSDRVFRGAAWVAGVRVIQKAIAAARTVIVARLLVPEDIGLFGIASITLLGVEVLTRTGFDEGLIQRREVSGAVHSAFWIQAVRGFVIAGLTYLAAPAIATFFNEPAAAPVLRVFALLQIIRGFRSVGMVLLVRDLRFRQESVYQLSSAVVEFAVTVGLTVAFRSVWGLVLGALAGELTRTLLSYVVHGYRPALRFAAREARELFGFGVWLLFAGIVSYVALQADNIFVGRFLGAEALGVYQMAFFIAHLPTTEIVKQVTKVLFPAYAELRGGGDSARLNSAVARTVASIAVFLVPVSLVLLFVGPHFAVLLLGDQWALVASIIPALVVGGMLRSFAAMANPLLLAAGKSSAVFASEAGRALALALFLYPAYLLGGLTGVAWAASASIAISLSVSGMAAAKIVDLRSVMRRMRPVLGAGIPLFAILAGTAVLLPDRELVLYASAFGGVVSYLLLLLLLDRNHPQSLLRQFVGRVQPSSAVPRSGRGPARRSDP